MQDFLENTEPRTIATLLIGIILLVAAALFMYLLLPEIKSYRSLDASHALLEQTATGNDSLASQLGEIDSEVQHLSRQLYGDMAQLPDREMESFVIGRLQKVSWKTDVELLGVQPGTGRQVQNFRESLFEVKLRASYADFFEWLQRVNHELGYIVVKKFDIRPRAGDDPDNPMLDLQLTLVSYRLVQADAS